MAMIKKVPIIFAFFMRGRFKVFKAFWKNCATWNVIIVVRIVFFLYLNFGICYKKYLCGDEVSQVFIIQYHEKLYFSKF